MRRSLALALVVGLSAPLLVHGDAPDQAGSGAGADAGAGGGAGGSASAGDPATAWMSPREREAVALLDRGKPVTARRVAEELLERDPDSIAGHYVLGRVLHEAEGALARAIFHLGHARELYEKRYPPARKPESTPWQFHRELLLSIATLAGEMEEHDYQLEMLDYHDALYRPPRPGEHAWPLLKLGRLDEARAAARKAGAMKDPGERSLGLNALCAIERSGHDRAAARTACRAAYQHAQDQESGMPGVDAEHRSTLAVHAYNAALAARAAFAAEEAEKLALAGTRRLAFTPANPWRFLVGLYLDEGRGGDAANAVREMQRWRVRQPPQLRDQDRSETDAMVATVLLVAGRTEAALRLVDRAVDFPDRRGLESTEEWQARAAHLLLRGAIRRADRELVAEAASVDGAGGGLVRGARRRLDDWADDERMVGLLGDDDRLVDTLRLFGERGITPVPVWLLGDLVPVVGPGVMAAVLRMVREREKTPELEPYWDEIEAEVHLARGREAEARERARKALAALPQTEALLRARAAAVAAQAARELGDPAAELELMDQAYRLDPSIIRRMGLSLPVKMRGSGPLAGEVMAMLGRSPRLRAADRGFALDVSASPGSFRICLRSPEGNELRCAPGEEAAAATPAVPGADAKKPEPMTPARAVEEFHRSAFAMPLGLTGADMSSLDGSTTVAEQAVRDRIDQMLHEIPR
jgi:tetratricopeptide (TPR) repeat protein